MFDFWWIVVVAGCAAFSVGVAIWLHTAIALTRVVTPSAKWLGRESQYNLWGSRLMVIGFVLAVIGGILALGLWM